MKKFKDLKLLTKVNILICFVLVVLMSVAGIVMYKIQKQQIDNDMDKQMFENVNNLSYIIELQLKERQTQIENSIKTAKLILSNKGKLAKTKSTIKLSIREQSSFITESIEIETLKIGNENIFQNKQLIDGISNITNSKVTIFQKINKGFVRIASNVEGNNVIGSYLNVMKSIN